MAQMRGIGRGNNPASRANLKPPFQKGDGHKGKGQPKKTIRRIKDVAAENGCVAPSATEIIECYRTMLGLNETGIKEIIEDKRRPMLERIVAKEILGKRGYEVIEKIIDRVCGKPKQVTDITTNGKEIKDSKFEIEIIDSRTQVEAKE